MEIANKNWSCSLVNVSTNNLKALVRTRHICAFDCACARVCMKREEVGENEKWMMCVRERAREREFAWPRRRFKGITALDLRGHSQ